MEHVDSLYSRRSYISSNFGPCDDPDYDDPYTYENGFDEGKAKIKNQCREYVKDLIDHYFSVKEFDEVWVTGSFLELAEILDIPVPENATLRKVS